MGTYCEPIRQAEWHERVEKPWREAEEVGDGLQQALELAGWLMRSSSEPHEVSPLADVPADAQSIEIVDPLEELFQEQADKWERETSHLSSPTQRFMHPSYQAILGMGQEHREEVIRLLILDMQKHRRQWFWALSYLTHDNPIEPADAGKIDSMVEAWVAWGKRRGLL